MPSPVKQLTVLANVATTKCDVCDYILYAILAFNCFSRSRVRSVAQSETEARRNLRFKDRDRVTWIQSRLIPYGGQQGLPGQDIPVRKEGQKRN